MDNPLQTGSPYYTVISIVMAFISIASAREIVSLVAGIGAICSAIMAVRYYYYAIKKVKGDKN